MAKKAPLAGVNQLFTDAWTLTKDRFWSVVLLGLIQSVLIGLIVIGVGIALFASSLGTIINSGVFADGTISETELTSMDSLGPLLGMVGIFLLVVMLIAIIVGPLFQGALVAMAASDVKLSVGEALGKGWKKFLPVVSLGLLSAFVVIGGIGFGVLPGIVFAILLSFGLYEVVLQDVGALQAMRNSAGMVWKYFWPVVGRMLVLTAVAIGVGLISDALTQQQQPILSLIDMILNLAFTVFSLMYSAALYKSLRSVAGNVSMTLTVMGIFSFFGWVTLWLLVNYLITQF